MKQSVEQTAASLTAEEKENVKRGFKKILIAELIAAVICLVLHFGAAITMGINYSMKTCIGAIILSVIVIVVVALIANAVVKSQYPYYSEKLYFYLRKKG